MKFESRKRLEDFIERAKLIQTYSYFSNSENIIGFEIHKVDDEWKVYFHQPDREQTDSILFNLRLFVQNKDDISIGRLAELCDDKDISEKWKTEYLSIRNQLNIRLEMLAAEGLKGEITFRDIFEMMLFGALGHRSENDKSYKMFKRWVTDEKEWAITYNMFHDVIAWVFIAVTNIAKISIEELEMTSRN
jgi:hypothetical protein